VRRPLFRFRREARRPREGLVLGPRRFRGLLQATFPRPVPPASRRRGCGPRRARRDGARDAARRLRRRASAPRARVGTGLELAPAPGRVDDLRNYKAKTITCARGSTNPLGHDQSCALAPPPDDEHDCGWKAYAKAQEQKLDELTAKLAAVTAKLQELERR